MSVRGILNAAQAAQAGALLGENVKLVKKKKLMTKDMVKASIKNIVGARLLSAQSNEIAKL